MQSQTGAVRAERSARVLARPPNAGGLRVIRRTVESDRLASPSRAQVVAALRDGATLEDLERMIAAAPLLDEEQRSALWLFAWCCVEACRPIRPIPLWRR
jgi:hypothetical protein